MSETKADPAQCGTAQGPSDGPEKGRATSRIDRYIVVGPTQDMAARQAFGLLDVNGDRGELVIPVKAIPSLISFLARVSAATYRAPGDPISGEAVLPLELDRDSRFTIRTEEESYIETQTEKEQNGIK